ncbi:MAG: type II toxin-antitoxin system HicB family antitoxin [Endomicrobiia bacterium]|nr:type II toxin-antitoxin system HicB family antitoxin [Endomicrobiia bacterium]
MKKKFTSIITREGKWYVAHCLELGVVSQGRTTSEAKANLKEAVELYIESFGRAYMPDRSEDLTLSELEVSVK